MAEHTANTEQFPWSQHAQLTYRRFQLRNNFLLGAKNLVPNPFLNWSFYCSGTAQAFGGVEGFLHVSLLAAVPHTGTLLIGYDGQ